jgi:pimeloyl-ACP methyl ester carboxylesterase
MLYLHGFASSPQSRKARFFAGRFEPLHIPMLIPDLAQGDFEHLTVSGQLQLIERLTKTSKYTVIGSSLGGYLAALFAARYPERVDCLVLLAPAFGFYQLWTAALGPQKIAEWKEAGHIDVFHYGEGREMPLSYQFLEDAAQFEPFPAVSQPVLIAHGDRDDTVPIEQSLAFVEQHPRARLVRYSSGHELTDVLESIWYETELFLFSRCERSS